MKKIKIIFLIMLIMIVSGCKIRSEINVFSDGITTETVTITEGKTNKSYSNEDYDSIINTELQNYKLLINYGKYEYEEINDKKQFGLKFTKKYNNICSYFQDTLFNQYIYKHISCKEDEKFIVITNDTPILDAYLNETSSDPLDLSDVQLSITLPVKALENDADIVEGNTYIWEFDNTPNGKNINLKIDKDDMKQANLETQKQEKINKVFEILKTIIIIGIIGGGAFYLGRKIYIKYQENKIEY